MKKNYRRILQTLICAAFCACAAPRAGAEDIDLFVSSATNAATNPNVLIVLDNSANWSAANQGWPGGVKQGQSELRSLRTLVNELSDNVNVGLMMLTQGTGGNANGGYIRFDIRQMTAANKAALRELIGDNTCVNGANSLNGTPNCIYNNFDSPTEKIGSSGTDYSRALFEVFKYFGGYTSPANANSDTAGTPVDTTAGPTATNFGPVRYSGNPDAKIDPSAFLNGGTGARTTYDPVLATANACAQNFVIFIGNGFPSADTGANTILSNVGGTTTQLAMPTYSVLSSGATVSLGSDTACHTTTACVTAAQSITDYQGYPINTWSCTTQASTTATGCPTGTQKNLLMRAQLTQAASVATGSLAVPASSKTRYSDEWAKFLFSTDVSSAAGRQYVQTYTIDVFKDQPDTDQNALLASMAKYGGGKYFQATSESAILDALRRTVIEIQSVNSVFASASLPINATNRSQNENQVFIGMFRPDAGAKPRWYGNLKRYQIGLFGQDAKLADKFGLEAVSTTTGFVQACATSFWTTDSSTYWDYAASAGTCTTSSFNKFSDAPDGPLVEKGATAEVVRRGNNPPTTDTTATYAVNRSVYTCTSTSGCNCVSGTGCTVTTSPMDAFNTTNVSAAELGVVDSADQTAIVNYTLGQDVGAENSVSVSGDTTSTLDVRGSVHGDVAHSRPLPVNYGGSTGVVLYYGANDGAFRAVRGSDGKELWAFVAPEHHPKLQRLQKNEPIISYTGVSLSLLPTPQKKDYFFDGSAGLYQTFNADNTANTVWVFPTMRRGGRMVYAFDASSPTSPKMKWRIGCPNLTDDTGCVSGFTHMGQTWSFPNVALVKGYSTTAPVIIMGAGYDNCEDSDSSTPTCTSTKGNRVYVIDADTGAKLAELTTDRAVAGDVTLIDRDFDGFVDHGYVADTGGNFYRVDFVDPSSLATRAAASWTITKIAATTGGGRKFMFGPAALPASGKVFLSIVSGDRERPLVNNYPFVENVHNRAYMLIDKFATTGLPIDLDSSSLANFTSSTSCSAAITSSQNGWFFDLNGGQGEQGVTSSIIFGGLVFFSSNRPLTGTAGSCSNNLGEARGYAVNLLNASGAVGTGALCGGTRSNTFTGGGLPPSPVTGTVPIGGKEVTVMIGGIDRSGAPSSPIGSQKVKPSITQKRIRTYWYKKGDQ